MQRRRKDNGQVMRILDRLDAVGYVDNFWAIENRILRLGALVYRIRHGEDGIVPINLIGEWGRDVTDDERKRKNYYYFTEKAHGRPINE